MLRLCLASCFAVSACATAHGDAADGGSSYVDARPQTLPDGWVWLDAAPIDDAAHGDGSSPLQPDAAAASSSCATAALADADGSFELHQHSGAAGTRDYWLYVPADYDGSPRPLLLLFHGCTQSAAELSVASQYNRVAATHGFLVAWPEQSLMANGAGCWNWFMAAHQQRGSGEPAIVAALTAEIAASYAIDPKRTYVGGFSAGAAMALVMAATYPDVYAAVVSVAGCPYGGGCYGLEAAATLASGLVAAMGGYARAMPVFIANGSVDTIVQPAASDLIAGQWLGGADLLDDGIGNQSVASEPALVTGGAVNGMTFERRFYAAGAQTLAEHWLIDGLDHAWCGGSSADTYGHDLGPNLSVESYRFLCEHPMP